MHSDVILLNGVSEYILFILFVLDNFLTAYKCLHERSFALKANPIYQHILNVQYKCPALSGGANRQFIVRQKYY